MMQYVLYGVVVVLGVLWLVRRSANQKSRAR